MAAPAPSPSGLMHLPPTPSHSPLVAPKRLRSCLSPTRRYPSNPLDAIPISQHSTISSTDELPPLTMSSAASTPMTSRSASFSSTCDDGVLGMQMTGWRRTKSVRWEEQGEGVAAAYYSTWSADDYDRSPLDPPKPEERACILPARNSRCLSAGSCFLDTSIAPYVSPVVSPVSYTRRADSNVEDDSDIDADAEAEAEADAAEDDEWEKRLSERRMLMFAHAQKMQRASSPSSPSFTSASSPMAIPIPGAGLGSGSGSGTSDRPTIEGYTSLTASLAEMFTGSGTNMEARDVSTPVGSPVENEAEGAFGKGAVVEEAMRGRPRLVRRGDGRIPIVFEDEEEESEEDGEADDGEDDEDDDDDARQPSLATVMAALRAYRSGLCPVLGTGDEQRDTSE